MSDNQIQPYEPAPLDEPAAIGLPGGPSPQGPNLLGMLLGMLRRWPTILLVWLLVAPAGLTAVWKLVQPFFTATALVEVAPVVSPIVFPDPTPAIPDFYTYLNTQAQVIRSRQVLAAALADPATRDVALQRTSDPLGALQRSLTVTTVSRTQLLEIAVQQVDRDAAMRLARSVLEAYIARAVGLDTQSTLRRREALLRELQDLRETMTRLRDQSRKVAAEAGTASDTVFNVRRQGLEVSIAGDRQKLEELDLQMLDYEQQILQLNQGSLPEDLASQREQMIDADPGVRWVKKEIADETAKLARLHVSLPADHKDVQAVQKSLDHLQTELERERVRAAVMADREIHRKQQQRVLDARGRLGGALAAARQKRELLQARVQARDAEGIKVGRQGLDIQSLDEQRAQAKADYDRVADALKQLNTESQRPTRISVAALPEIRPDGIKDRRVKLSLVVLVMATGLACLAGLARDFLDPHVHNSQQVEAGIGLRMLGAIPSVKELHAGLIGKEHFLESYRLIRTTLAGLGTDGAAPQSILITSAQAAEGKTSLAISLAISLAEPGDRVLLIDGDIQSPQVGRLLKIDKPCGQLREVLLGERELRECTSPSGIGGLDVLTGHSNGQTARSLLNTRSARQLIRQAVGQYDHVIVDSPPALGAADSLVWAHAVEGVIVTSLVGYSDRKAIKLACQRLVSVGAKLLGSVVANVSTRESYYSYSTTSCRGGGELALTHKGGPARRTLPLVHLPGSGEERHGDKGKE